MPTTTTPGQLLKKLVSDRIALVIFLFNVVSDYGFVSFVNLVYRVIDVR